MIYITQFCDSLIMCPVRRRELPRHGRGNRLVRGPARGECGLGEVRGLRLPWGKAPSSSQSHWGAGPGVPVSLGKRPCLQGRAVTGTNQPSDPVSALPPGVPEGHVTDRRTSSRPLGWEEAVLQVGLFCSVWKRSVAVCGLG